MKKVLLMSVVIIFVLGIMNTAYALSNITFKCGNLSVARGLHSAVVEYNCGEPLKKEYLGMSERKLTLENWIYGPIGGYYYILTFTAGKISQIERTK
ncbi:DUF2845 domain-containing protein [Thermodesulfobacteriota bacterium]